MKTQKRRQTLRANYGHLVIGGHWSDVWSPGHVIAPHSSSYSMKLESFFVNILFVSQHSSVCDEERVTINKNLSDRVFALRIGNSILEDYNSLTYPRSIDNRMPVVHISYVKSNSYTINFYVKCWWLLFLAMTFTFIFLNLAKIHIFCS